MSRWRTVIGGGVIGAVVPGAWVVAASPAEAAAPWVHLTMPHRLIVNYVETCKPYDASAWWEGGGSGVTKVVMTLAEPNGKVSYRETAKPGETHGLGAGCGQPFGKWTIRVAAYNRAGKVLARRSLSYFHKGNTQIKSFNAAPEPVRKGGKITVSGRLMHVKYERPPWYIGYPGKPIRIYFKAKGATAWSYVGATKTASDGRFRKRFTAKKDGAWRAYFPGTSRYDKETTAGDFVDVR